MNSVRRIAFLFACGKVRRILEFKHFSFVSYYFSFELKHFYCVDDQMSFLMDSPVHSSSSDNFAAFLDAELESESVESSQGDGVEDNSYTERGR